MFLNNYLNKSDKNSLFDGGSIGDMGLCVKKDKSQSMGVLGYPAARGIVRDARQGWRGFAGAEMLWSREYLG
jgi:hypothetical protein